jgi:tungstate transport system permease protein
MTLSTLWEALSLLFSGDRETYLIILRTFLVSGSAVLLGSLAGIPWGYRLSFRAGFWPRLVQTLMGIPPVVVGLFVYLLASRQGPLGALGWLFTPWVMILAQWLLVTPIVATLSRAAIIDARQRYEPLLLALGANPKERRREVLREARPALYLAVAAGLGRAMAEVGAVMLVGGNIKGSTRVLTTAIVLETRQGNFAKATALGLVLLLLSGLLNFWLEVMRERGWPHVSL